MTTTIIATAALLFSIVAISCFLWWRWLEERHEDKLVRWRYFVTHIDRRVVAGLRVCRRCASSGSISLGRGMFLHLPDALFFVGTQTCQMGNTQYERLLLTLEGGKKPKPNTRERSASPYLKALGDTNPSWYNSDENRSDHVEEQKDI